MENLAGDKDASAKCAIELQAAGVPNVLLTPEESRGEVGSRAGGKLGDFTFRRLWHYWAVRGPMPLDAAEQIYADPRGRYDVRAAGHCGAPHPQSEVPHHPDPPPPHAHPASSTYHVDTAEGLRLVADMIKALGNTTALAA